MENEPKKDWYCSFGWKNCEICVPPAAAPTDKKETRSKDELRRLHMKQTDKQQLLVDD